MELIEKYTKVDNANDDDDHNISFDNNNEMVSLDDFIDDSFLERLFSDYTFKKCY